MPWHLSVKVCHEGYSTRQHHCSSEICTFYHVNKFICHKSFKFAFEFKDAKQAVCFISHIFEFRICANNIREVLMVQKMVGKFLGEVLGKYVYWAFSVEDVV